MSMIKPIANRILVRPDEVEKQTVSGIILPDSQEKPLMGTIVGIGDLVMGAFSLNQRVLFSKYGFDEIEYEKQKLYIISETNVLAIIEK